MIQDIAPHKYDVTYRKAQPEKEDTMLIYRKGELLCHLEGDQITYPSVEEISKIYPEIYQKAKFLFRIDEINYFELRKTELEEYEDWSYLPKEGLRNARPIWKAYAGITGFQIHKWYTENQFCGRCGTKMEPQGVERAMRCPACGKLSYPTICPSVIVGITKGNQILLTKYSSNHSSYKKYALVAGYAEVGESLEDTVRREVLEEVGLKVKNIRYYKSQPWSFTDTLLIGYFCEVEGDSCIHMDEDELSEAEWFERDAMPSDCSEASISLTGEMMDAFRQGYTI